MFSGNLHPLVVHFPIVLVCIYPLIVLGMMFWKREKRALDLLGGVLLFLALVSMIFATETGEGLEFAIKRISAEIYRAFEQHEKLSEGALMMTYITFFVHVVYVFLHSEYGKKLAFQKDQLKGGFKRFFSHIVFRMRKFEKWILRLLLALSVVLVGFISLVGSTGGTLAHHYRVGALACLEIAHPLDDIVQSILPLEEKLESWKEKYAPEANLTAKELFTTLCIPSE